MFKNQNVPWFNADNARFDFWRRSKVVLANFHKVINSCQELCIDGQAAIELVTRLSDQSLGKFTLKHKNGTSKEWTMQKKFEHQR